MMQSPNDYMFSFPDPARPYNRNMNKKNRSADLDLWPTAQVISIFRVMKFSFQIKVVYALHFGACASFPTAVFRHSSWSLYTTCDLSW